MELVWKAHNRGDNTKSAATRCMDSWIKPVLDRLSLCETDPYSRKQKETVIMGGREFKKESNSEQSAGGNIFMTHFYSLVFLHSFNKLKV